MRRPDILPLLKQALLTMTLIAMFGNANAQNADSVYNKYTDMNLARLEGNTSEALNLATQILPQAKLLPKKSQIPFYNTLAKLYEDTDQFDKAQPLYEKVIAAVPEYYVAHLALGHLYLRKADELSSKMNVSTGNAAAYQKLRTDYIAAVNKALPHLEKVQACDPYDENLQLITKLYNDIGNPAGVNGLDGRVKELKKKCVDILDEN
jgi:tetratricopeptide (TPR) repeat protein